VHVQVLGKGSEQKTTLEQISGFIQKEAYVQVLGKGFEQKTTLGKILWFAQKETL
jgi:hypothetical protein